MWSTNTAFTKFCLTSVQHGCPNQIYDCRNVHLTAIANIKRPDSMCTVVLWNDHPLSDSSQMALIKQKEQVCIFVLAVNCFTAVNFIVALLTIETSDTDRALLLNVTTSKDGWILLSKYLPLIYMYKLYSGQTILQWVLNFIFYRCI